MTTWIEDIRKFHAAFPDVKYKYTRVDSASSSSYIARGVEYEKLVELIGEEEGMFVPIRGYREIHRFPCWIVNTVVIGEAQNEMA